MRHWGLLPRSAVDARRARKVRRITTVTVLTLALVLGCAFGIPRVMVTIGEERAAACLARYEEPRGDVRPDCGEHVAWFVFPSRLPWNPVARYRGEEVLARIAIANYLDAAVSRPDRAALNRETKALDDAAKAIHQGSQRTVLGDIGPEVGAPDLGKMVDDVGDRSTLIARGPQWVEWSIRLHALEAAMLEGGQLAAVALAKTYAGWDPRDEDLRAAVGALLCLGGDGKRALTMLGAVQEERATRRYAAIARNWGDIRTVLMACAARAGVEPPPKPTSNEAGSGDPVVPRAALRMRLLASARGKTPKDTAALREALDATKKLLDDPPHTRESRIALLAAILTVDHPGAAELTRLLGGREGDLAERPLEPPPVLTALDILDEERGLRAVVPAASLVEAAETLSRVARDSAPPGGGGVDRLRAAAATLWMEAGQALARRGEGDAAVQAVSGAAPVGFAEPLALALAKSSVLYVAGQPARALAMLDEAGAAEPAALPPDAPGRALRAAALIQRAELLASLGRAGEAAQAILVADDTAAASGDAAIDARGRWTRVALANPGARVRQGSPAANGAWPWVGFADVGATWVQRESGGPAIASSLAVWASAIDASPEQRRAVRYRAFRRRGDAPRWHVAELVMGARLLSEGPPAAIEMWLDAFYAIDARRMTMRYYAWSRAEAARWRGDADSASAWARRYIALRDMASDPASAELAAFLGI
jgi:tetratricopeptide (TPR) repeat protein